MSKFETKQTRGAAVRRFILGGFVAVFLFNAVGAECAEKGKPSVAGPFTLYSIGAFADAYSTDMALRNPNVTEANPLMQNQGTRIGIKAAEVVTLTLIDRAIAKKNPKAAKIMRVVVFASRIALAAHNMQNARAK